LQLLLLLLLLLVLFAVRCGDRLRDFGIATLNIDRDDGGRVRVSVL
jgi:hypothetical protein